MAARIMVNAPASAAKGEVIEIKTMIAHKMETGHRMGAMGQIIPRDIIHRFECRYDGALVFAADLFPAVSANPFITFTTVATKSGKISFKWIDDKGKSSTSSVKIKVT